MRQSVISKLLETCFRCTQLLPSVKSLCDCPFIKGWRDLFRRVWRRRRRWPSCSRPNPLRSLGPDQGTPPEPVSTRCLADSNLDTEDRRSASVKDKGTWKLKFDLGSETRTEISHPDSLISDPDPAFQAQNRSGSGSGSTDLIESGSNPNSDPKHCKIHRERTGRKS